MQDLIGYDQIIEDSMREVVPKILEKIKKKGLLGSHYFIVSFSTKFPGVEIPKEMKKKYPNEMTIIIQHQFSILSIEKKQFTISLSFSGIYKNLTIPYKAISTFTDPSINFTLKFNQDLEENDEEFIEDDKNKFENDIDISAKIISLADFKKHKKGDED